MPRKEKAPAEVQEKAPKKPDAQTDILTSTAKAIGSAAGKIATLTGIAHPPPPAEKKSAKSAKLAKTNKSRLPRRQKKAARKAAEAKSVAKQA
jgi:hypothetical protein